ncbi:MAG: tRNA (5-methylaminomethyl-2-thiouridine)(34)-methyltransferase MnmD [Bacteroidetes bacterium]|nr:tRNA (5-methylaminomethyl-2-thiouridine)(34)-methyltransferase MnmD [Bacteroidota bacterium]
MRRELVGSHTLFLPEVNENYHSCHGAINESKHVFIKNGLEYYSQQAIQVNILEVGMGTGLNVFLTFLHSVNESKQSVNYFAIEPFPLEMDIVQQLNYPVLLNAGVYADQFSLIHSTGFNESTRLSDHFLFTKKNEKLEQFKSDGNFDIVFFDAFAPRVQPELWTKAIFDRLYTFLKPGGIIVTYCAKGEVKRNLRASNFKVESLPGPPGKREMVRAVKLI